MKNGKVNHQRYVGISVQLTKNFKKSQTLKFDALVRGV